MSKTKYVAKYKSKGLFTRWTTFNNVVGDGFIEKPIMLRYFAMDNGEMVYFPVDYEVWFSKERKTSILESMSKDAGQQIISS